MLRMVLLTTAMMASAAGAVTPPAAKLSMAQARAIALKKAPGTVAKGEYEKEGGSWRYSFDIKQHGRIHEIGVDGNTGRIVEDKFERPGDKD